MAVKPINELSAAEEQRAAELYSKSIIIEGLTYAPVFNHPTESLNDIRKAGVTASHITVTRTSAGPLESLQTIADWYAMAERENLRLACTPDDIVQSKRDGKLCIIMGTQNANNFGDDLRLVRIFHRLGLRVAQLAYAEQNYIGSGGEDVDGGVSLFGRKVIDEMNKVGMLIDVSHCADKTVMDAIKYSALPIAFTHANPRKLINHHRNKTDEAMLACAEKGGVIGLTAWALTATVKRGVRPTLENFMDMIDYDVKLVGIDRVAFGLDLTPNWEYDREDYEKWAKMYPGLAPARYEDRLVEGLEHVSQVKNVARGLVARGYSDADIQKLLGGNLLELYRKVWRR